MAGTLKYAAEYQRAVALRQRRNLKMAGSVHANMPGNALKFYEWLGTADSSTIPVGRQFGSAINLKPTSQGSLRNTHSLSRGCSP